jgi:hypothetical protein
MLSLVSRTPLVSPVTEGHPEILVKRDIEEISNDRQPLGPRGQPFISARKLDQRDGRDDSKEESNGIHRIRDVDVVHYTAACRLYSHWTTS